MEQGGRWNPENLSQVIQTERAGDGDRTRDVQGRKTFRAATNSVNCWPTFIDFRGLQALDASLGNWASIEYKRQWRLLRPFLNTSTRTVSRFCLFSPS